MGFYAKLALGAISLAALGLFATLAVVNTMVRGAIYESALDIAQREKAVHRGELNSWFSSAGQAALSLAAAMEALPQSPEGLAAVARGFTERFGFIENAFAGFADGSIINGVGWTPGGEESYPGGVGWGPWDEWASTGRPWFVDALAAGGGGIAATEPYWSYATGNVTAAIATWSPGLAGMGAAVGFSLSIEHVLGMIAERAAADAGYLMLTSPAGAIIFHPDPCLRPCEGGLRNLRDIPNGEFMMGEIASGRGRAKFKDEALGKSYFMPFPLDAVGWTLSAVVPAGAARAPAYRNLLGIMLALSLILVTLLLLVTLLVSRLARGMEERSASEERLRLVIDNMPMVSNISRGDAGIVECNSEGPRLFGLGSKGEYIERFGELSPEFQPDGRRSKDKAFDMDSAALETGHQRFEWMHRTAAGEPLPCEVTLVRVRWHGEDQILSFVRDLREAREARRKEQEIADRVRLVLDAAPLAVEFWDADGNITDCNQTALDFYGFDTKDDLRNRWAETLPELQPDGTGTRKKIESHLGRIFRDGSDRFSFVERRRGGGEAHLEVVGYRIRLNGKTLAATYSQDVTRLRKAAEMTREAEERAQLMLDGAPVACYLIDRDFEAIDCNREALNLFGFRDKPDGVGRFRSIFSQYRYDKLSAHFEKALRDGGSRFEWVLQRPGEEEYVPCELSLVRFSHRGGPVVAAYIFDLRAQKGMIWERQRVEAAEERGRAKSRFLARMGKEIRTPITAILGVSEAQLQGPALPPPAGGAFSRVQESARALLQIVDDILDLSQIEAGALALEEAEYDTAGMIAGAVQEGAAAAAAAAARGVEFRMSVDESLPGALVGDEARVRQIIGNLLSNALKYTPSGWVELSLRRQGNGKGGGATLVAGVRDTGLGMTQGQLDELNDERARLGDRESRSVRSAGLGMPIVFSLAQMMGARIDVDSEEGKGTSVVARIPQGTAGAGPLGAGGVAAVLARCLPPAGQAASLF